MKYRQKGYRDDEWQEERRQQRKREQKPDLGNREQIRSLRHAIDREVTVVTRCGRCGHQVPTSQLEIDTTTTCSKCQTPLHSCRHCTHFDPGVRWECRAPIEVRIPDKWAMNKCKLFKPAQVLDATGRRADVTEDARAAFHNLFKP
ncbi:MAG: hypothetical protein ACE5JI_13510 [Acidobacteriota bacterium]